MVEHPRGAGRHPRETGPIEDTAVEVGPAVDPYRLEEERDGARRQIAAATRPISSTRVLRERTSKTETAAGTRQRSKVSAGRKRSFLSRNSWPRSRPGPKPGSQKSRRSSRSSSAASTGASTPAAQAPPTRAPALDPETRAGNSPAFPAPPEPRVRVEGEESGGHRQREWLLGEPFCESSRSKDGHRHLVEDRHLEFNEDSPPSSEPQRGRRSRGRLCPASIPPWASSDQRRNPQRGASRAVRRASPLRYRGGVRPFTSSAAYERGRAGRRRSTR